MDPLVGSTLLDMGGGVLSWLGGRGKEKRLRGQYEGDRSRMQGMMGKQPFDPYSIAALSRRGVANDTRALGNKLDNSYGMDIGSGAGGLWGGMLGKQQGMLAQALMQSKMSGFNRDSDLARMLLGSSSQMYGGA